MIEKDLMAILQKLFNDVDVANITIQDASTLREGNETVKEFDVIINENLHHSQIQALDRILADYDEIEMRTSDNGMKIISTGINPRIEGEN
jgi:hypothetical protein